MKKIMIIKRPVLGIKKLSQKTSLKNKAFTLVELIVVITILAILGTIGFLSFQSYNTYARDSVRLGNLKSLQSGLGIQYVKSGNYALPDDYVNITASGTLIRKQGVFGKKALRTVGASQNGFKDPLTEEYLDYSVGVNLQEYQLVTYLEGDEAMKPHPNQAIPHLASPQRRGIIGGVYADGIGTMKSTGEDLGIVFSGGVALHKTITNIGNDFDIIKDGEFTVKFSNDDEITSSGSRLFSSVYNHSKKLLKNKSLAKLDDSLVLYFDMETTTMSGSEVVLKDFSKYGNNGKLMGGIKIGTEQGQYGKATFFNYDGVKNPHIQVKDSLSLNIDTNEYTNLLYFKSSVKYQDFIYEYPILLIKRPWQVGGYAVHMNNIYGYVVNQYCYDGACIGDHSYGNIKKGQWTYYGGYKNNNELRTYLNGYFSQGINISDSMGSSLNSDLLIGDMFQGTIDEVRIYNRALSEEEIKNVYGSTLKN